MRWRCEGCGVSLAQDEIGGQGAVEEIPGNPVFHLALDHHPDCGVHGGRCVETCPITVECGPVMSIDEAFAEWRTHGEPVA